MTDPYNLQRFADAQEGIFDTALAELKAGSKQSHWMWFIFPQLADLGRSPTAKYFGISALDEAHAYLAHPLLGQHLHQSVEVLLPWAGKRSPEQIFGTVDTLKLRSSLTLFDRVAPASVCALALDGFFDGEPDESTLALLGDKDED